MSDNSPAGIAAAAEARKKANEEYGKKIKKQLAKEAKKAAKKANNASSLPSLAVKRKHAEPPLKEKTAKLASACQLMTDSEYCDGGKKRNKISNWQPVSTL